jgi:hypothetical protein
VRKALVDVLHTRLDALERRQVAIRSGLEVDVVQPPVLVATPVLEVEEVAVVVRPVEEPDPAVPIVGDDACVLSVEIADPGVQDTVLGSDPGEASAVRRDSGAEPFGIAEEDRARDERNDRITLREPGSGEPGPAAVPRNPAEGVLVQRHMCICCREVDVEHELGICERCALPTCIEYLTGLQRLERYLEAWAAFRDWEGSLQPAY